MILLKASLFLCIFSNTDWAHAKISPEIQRAVDRGETSNVIVECSKSQSPESQKFENILKQIKEASESAANSRSDIITHLVQRAQEHVVTFLDEVIVVLKELGVKFEVLWISYEIFIPEATSELISRLVEIGIVVIIRHDPILPYIRPQPQPSGSQIPPQGNTTWNHGLIDARCDGINCFGEGVILGFLDSGARATHVEIKDNWMGKDTPYGYLDGYLRGCEPTDEMAHGTHVVGSACGKTVGVAPQAKWMMCRACADNDCSESSIKICALWASCPYECGDTSETKITKNCTMRPHVINNSWGGTEYLTSNRIRAFFYEYAQYWNSLGIISIFSAGNEGPGCNSVNVGISYDITFSVGAVDANVALAWFSGIGPALWTRPLTKDSISIGTCSETRCSNQNTTCSLIKPTIVAPGIHIRSSVPTNDTSYAFYDGTSMATPHVTGVVALMICANPRVKWNYKKAYEILTTTTDTSRIDLEGGGLDSSTPIRVQNNLLCNVVLSNIYNTFPNNMYGYGLINACKAVAASKKLSVGSNLGWS